MWKAERRSPRLRPKAGGSETKPKVANIGLFAGTETVRFTDDAPECNPKKPGATSYTMFEVLRQAIEAGGGSCTAQAYADALAREKALKDAPKGYSGASELHYAFKRGWIAIS